VAVQASRVIRKLDSLLQTSAGHYMTNKPRNTVLFYKLKHTLSHEKRTQTRH